jgi:transcriptional regulator GlxA family with amidase domain
VAEAAGQSERQLRRRFEQAVGESPQQYLLRVRIEVAQSLLRETNLLMIDIAAASGFTGSAYFSRIFKKHTSMSPGGYRTMVRNKRFSVGSDG